MITLSLYGREGRIEMVPLSRELPASLCQTRRGGRGGRSMVPRFLKLCHKARLVRCPSSQTGSKFAFQLRHATGRSRQCISQACMSVVQLVHMRCHGCVDPSRVPCAGLRLDDLSLQQGYGRLRGLEEPRSLCALGSVLGRGLCALGSVLGRSLCRGLADFLQPRLERTDVLLDCDFLRTRSPCQCIAAGSRRAEAHDALDPVRDSMRS